LCEQFQKKLSLVTELNVLTYRVMTRGSRLDGNRQKVTQGYLMNPSSEDNAEFNYDKWRVIPLIALL